MKNILLSCITFLLFIPIAKSDLGLNVGLGLPYVSQYGINYTMGPSWSVNLEVNTLDISTGEASVKLGMNEFGINWHPFAGSFFIGLGIGQQKLEVSASDLGTGASASVDVTSTTTIAKLGWMWGKADGGLWFGMDLAFISPTGSEVNVETTGGLGTNTQEYQDVLDAGEQFGSTAYANITFARLGYLF